MVWFLVLVIVVLADQASKQFVVAGIESCRPLRPGPAIMVRPRSNPRLGFGLVGRRFLLVTAIAMVVLCVFNVTSLGFSLNNPLYTAGLTLAAGGALSNGMDLALRGATLDFIRIPRVTICNLADITICVGASLMTLGILQSV